MPLQKVGFLNFEVVKMAFYLRFRNILVQAHNRRAAIHKRIYDILQQFSRLS